MRRGRRCAAPPRSSPSRRRSPTATPPSAGSGTTSPAPGAATTAVPNGTDTEYFQPNGAETVAGRVVFVGPTHSHPNRDAVEFLLQEIWPPVRAANRATSLRLIGGTAPVDRARYDAVPGVTALGALPDIRPALSEACCCVVPIRIGGGTRLKILDAWAMG